MQKIFELINWSIKQIDEKNDWMPFCELVCNYIPHEKQLEYLTNSTFKENALHPGNGWGKTDVTAIKHLKFILKHFLDGPAYRTLNIAITLEQAQLVQERIVKVVTNSPVLSENNWLIKNNKCVTGLPIPKIKFCNESQVEFKSTKKKAESVEGKEYGYISADEIALEPHLEFIQDKILLPRLRAWEDSQMDFSATPKGQNAYFRVVEDIKRKGGHVQGGTSYDNPHIDHKLLDYTTTNWSQQKIDQTIMGKFLDTADMPFASRVPILFDNNLELEEVEKGSKYIEAWDLARGRKGENADQTVGLRAKKLPKFFQIVSRRAFQLPWTDKERENINNELGENKEKSSTEREIRNWQYESDAEVRLDSTGLGDTLYGMLQDIAEGIDFRGGRKDDMIEHAQAVIDNGKIKCPYIPELVDEMTTYQREDKNLSTDNVMVFIILCSFIEIEEENHFGTVDG